MIDASGPQIKPLSHEHIDVGARVRINVDSGMGQDLEGKTGEIGGIASVGLVFSYIVILDEQMTAPTQYPGHAWKAVVVPGPLLTPISSGAMP